MGIWGKFKHEKLEHISVKDKINYLVKLTLILAISAILFGIVGMLLSNLSIRSLNHNALEPLEHLRLIKDSYQQHVLTAAEEISQGKRVDYTKISQQLRVEKEKMMREWHAYKNGHLTQEERTLLPDMEKYIKLSFKSLDTLTALVEEKNLIAIVSWTTDDAQYTIIELIPIINRLMQVQIIHAQEIYSKTQAQFAVILSLIILISVAGMVYVFRRVNDVVDDITQATSKLIVQSKALTLDEPFIWTRTDEIGQVGKSFELSRQALHASFQEIAVKNKELLQQSRLAQMGEMISMIAHQWRQPLGAIASTTVNMKIRLEMESFDLSSQDGRDELNTFFIERLNKIEGYVQNLSMTIDDFRNFYKPDKKMVESSLKEVIKKALKIVENSLEMDNIKIVEEYCDGGRCELYDNEMIQVVLNLFKNAQDNFKEKGILNPTIRIKTQKDSLLFFDNGGGIPDEIIEKIFDPYFSTKDEKNGSGLGLHMSKLIVEEHHKGKLSAKNHDDGVCFEITLRSGK